MIEAIEQSPEKVSTAQGIHEFPSIQELIPHSDKMLLIDRVTELRSDGGTCEVMLRADRPYYDRGCFDSYWMIEIMAQSVAAIYALESRLRNRPVSMGFIIAIDEYTWESTQNLPCGEVIHINVHLEYDLHPFGQYITKAKVNGKHIASAQMKFVVDDAGEK